MNYKNILVCGSSQLAFEVARHIKKINLHVVVLEQKITSASTVEYLCSKNDISYYALNQNEMTDTLLHYINEPTLIINAVNYYIFPPEVVENQNATLVNYHNSILPLHRGMHPEAWQIFDNDIQTGVTWHYITKEIDAGPIISQSKIALEQTMTSISLLKIHNRLALEVFEGFFSNLLLSNIISNPQIEYQNIKAKKAKDIPGNGLIDINWDTDKIYAFLRAMDYGPLFTLGKPVLLHNGKHYTWQKYELKRTDENRAENQIIIKDNFIQIKCNGADLLLYKPQVVEK